MGMDIRIIFFFLYCRYVGEGLRGRDFKVKLEN